MPSPLLLLPNTYRAFYGRFSSLRPAQQEVIQPILRGQDLVLQAATGSGKTEAVLAPTLERVLAAGKERTVIYVVPTRALAGDLSRRVAFVLERLGVSLALRTGDRKRWSLRPDLLITTPESLDVALGSPNDSVRGFLRRVQTVILDEAHAYTGSRRGEQLRYLLHRLQRRTGDLQRIALSATLTDLEVIAASLGLQEGARCIAVPGGPKRRVQWAHLKGAADLLAFVDDLARTCPKVLWFADSRRRCESLHALLRGNGAFAGHCALHYSNLSTQERAKVEFRFREEALGLCIATSTLELGIDIGDVDAVVLDGPPATGSAFLQRAGRSGRRSGVTRVWGVIHGRFPGRQALRFAALEAMARSGDGERLRDRTYPSVLVQQVFSCLYEKRTLTLESLVSLFPEQVETLETLLPTLLTRGWIKEDRLGLLQGGWRFHDARMQRRIWSNFPPQQLPYSLVAGGETLAELPATVVEQLEPGQCVRLAGRLLRIVEVDPGERRRVDAVATTEPITHEPVWVGLSAPVSFEAAQAVARVLREPLPADLSNRAQRLLEHERERPVVALDNGIDLLRSTNGSWRYRTLLGTLGNVVLREAIMELHPDAMVASDALAVECSELVDFRQLQLPIGRLAFQAWVKRRHRRVRVATPAGAFHFAMPRELQLNELVEVVYEPRLDPFFQAFIATSGLPETLDALQVDAQRWSRPSLAAPGPNLAPPATCPRPVLGAQRPLSVRQTAQWISLRTCARYVHWTSRTNLAAPKEAGPILPNPTKAPVEVACDSLRRDGVFGAPDGLQLRLEDGVAHLLPRIEVSSTSVTHDQRWRLALHAWQLTPALPPHWLCQRGIVRLPTIKGAWIDVEIDLEPWLERLPGVLRRRTEALELSDPPPEVGPACHTCRFHGCCLEEVFTDDPLALIWSGDPKEQQERAEAVAEHRFVATGKALPFPPALLNGATVVEIGLDGSLGITSPQPEVFDQPDLVARVDEWLRAVAQTRGPLLIWGGRLRLEQLLEHASGNWRQACCDPVSGKSRFFDARDLFTTHLHTPVLGTLSLGSVAWVMEVDLPLPPTRLHPRGQETVLQRLVAIQQVVQRALPLFTGIPQDDNPGAQLVQQGPSGNFLQFLERQRRHRRTSILTLQQRPLVDRVARSRALGPLRLLDVELDHEGRPTHRFGIETATLSTRFRVGDFLLLAPLDLPDLQAGVPVVLQALDLESAEIHVQVRGFDRVQSNLRYSLEEDATDFGHESKVEAVLSGFDGGRLSHQLVGASPIVDRSDWVDPWLEGHGVQLERAQVQAIHSCVRHPIGLIEGPPGTGKTHVLAHLVLALVHRARTQGEPLRVAVTALTHRAIDELLLRVQAVAQELGEPLPVRKLGRDCEGVAELDPSSLEERWIAVGATGYGLHRLLGTSSETFDLLVCDEASQLLVPQAWIAMLHGKQRFVLAGDVHQLGPIVLGDEPEVEGLVPSRSVLEHLLTVHPSVRLDRSHRMCDGLCAFSSEQFYEGQLLPTTRASSRRLSIPGACPVLAADPPLCLVWVEHQGRRQTSPEEVSVLVSLTKELLDGGLAPTSLAVITPHRTQNRLIIEALRRCVPGELPRVDTVERMQGSEFDVVLLGLVVSDPDWVDRTFSFDPRRLNVSLTRARLKLVVVASPVLFSTLPRSEEAMLGRRMLWALKCHCEERGAVFSSTELTSTNYQPAASSSASRISS